MSGFANKLRNLPDFISLISATSEQISKAENKLGLKFSNEYREYLTECGVASANGHEFTGVCKSSRLNVVDVTISERIRNPNIQTIYYVVEQINMDRIVVWQSNSGEVFITTPSMPPIKLCNSLCEYLEIQR